MGPRRRLVIQTDSLRPLRPIFEKWLDTISHYIERYDKAHPSGPRDNPYWNGERATISSLAASAWMAGGMALEEYGVEKGKGYQFKGRADLWIMALDDTEFSIEAKWKELGIGRWTRPKVLFDGWLQEALLDARALRKPEGLPTGMVFVVPYLPISKGAELESRVGQLIEEFESFPADKVWWIAETRETPKDAEHLYPGVGVLMDLVHS